MKNIRKWFWALMLWGTIGGIGALPAQKAVYPGEWLYDALTALALEQGLVFFTGSALTIAQVELMLAEIDELSLSSSGMALYEQVHNCLAAPPLFSYTAGALALNIDPALQPEFYFKTNERLAWNHKPGGRLPFLSLPADISLSSYITLESDLYLGENRMLSNAHDNYANFPFDKTLDGVQSIDTNFPKRAYLSAGVPLWKQSGINFRIGIGDDAYGRTKTGSIILSDSMKGVNYANLTFYSPVIRYSTDIKQLEVNKYLYLHYFQMQFFNRLSIALVEGVMVNAPFELRYLNPMMIFHGFSAWEDYGGYNEGIGEEGLSEYNSRVGSLGGLIIEARPWRYSRIYGLAAMNEFEIPGIEGGDDSTVPNSLAFQLGCETYIPVSAGYWTFGLEGVYTYPYMYILSNKNWSFYRESNEVSNPPIRDWVGTLFGPDSIAGTLWAGYRHISGWSASLAFLMLVQGENSGTGIFDVPDKAHYPFDKPDKGYYPKTPEEAGAATPTGTPAYTYHISASGEWRPSKWLRVSLQTGYKIIQNAGHNENRLEHGFEMSLSIGFTPRGLWTVAL
ncbi:MAG: hypothetical protein LBD55_09285 [Treponema sp.]|jgi:hypothetical protein|nr:hypothetical protein [Treponema sp.]